jgi:hypothetical protein
MRDVDALIRERAYLIWEKSGKPAGRDRDHWFQAAREIEEAMAQDPLAVTAVEIMPEAETKAATPPAKPQAMKVPTSEAGPAPALQLKAAAAIKRMPIKKKK